MVSPAGHGARVGAPCPTWGTSSSPLQAGMWQLQVGATSASRKDTEKWRGSSQLGKEPTASSKKNHHKPSSWVCFTAKGSVTKLCGRKKERINAPKAAVKSTLQSSCFLCYLILILIEIFPAVLPGVLGSLCSCSSRASSAARPHTPAGQGRAGRALRTLPRQTFPQRQPFVC